MRIGLLINEIDGEGGIQKDYKILFDLFCSKDIEAYLFVLYPPQLLEINDKNIIFLKGITFIDKGLYLNYKLNRMGNFDLFLVNAEYMRPFLPKKINYYITVHNTWSSKIKSGIRGWVREEGIKKKYRYENLIGISKGVLDDIADTLHIPIKSKTVIYSPHDILSVRTLGKKEIEINGDYIIGIGGLQKNKRFDMLIRIYNDLIPKYPNLQLVIIGKGPERENIEQLISSLHLEEKVRLLGFKENPYPYIKNARLLISSSFSEGLPRVLVEALILNTPIVSTFSSKGIKEIMTGELEEFIAHRDDNEKLLEVILKALESYPTITDSMYDRFDINNVFKAYMELVQ